MAHEPTPAREPTHDDVVEVSLRWGGSLIAVQRLRGAGELTVGDLPGCSFLVSDPDLEGGSVPLVRRSGSLVEVHVGTGMRARVGDDEVPMASVLHLGRDHPITLQVGALIFEVRWATAQPSLRGAFWGTLDVLYSKVLALALVAQLGLVLAAFLSPGFAPDDEGQLAATPARFLIQAPQKPREVEKPKPQARVKTPEETASTTFGAAAPTKNPTRRDRRAANVAAALDAIRDIGAAGMGGDAGSIFGHLLDSQIGQLSARGIGSGGPGGTRGLDGPGGGGGVMGIGRLGGGLDGDPRGVDLPAKGKRPVTVVHRQPPQLVGALERGEIERVVRAHINQIRTCYERALGRDPNLQGKLVERWVISGTGAVAAVSTTQDTMNHAEVRGCVERVVRRMTFPRPRGGGTVTVTYPFLFDTAG